MSGTELGGREIPIAWQIEFDVSGEYVEAANGKLDAMGIEPHGYGWGEFITTKLRQVDRDLAGRLHLADCETDTCVIWVESEQDCRVLIEATWRLLFGR